MSCLRKASYRAIAILLTFAVQSLWAQGALESKCRLSDMAGSCFYTKANALKPNTKLLVFAHGVYSGAATAWGDPTTPTFWPYMVRNDPRFRDFDIYLLNYGSPYLGDTSNIYQVASQELYKLADASSSYSEIYFIAHSMGGLIVKEMLTMPNGKRREVANRTRGIVMLATPSQGATAATFAHFLGGSTQAGDMKPAHFNTYLQRLEDSWLEFMQARQYNIPGVSCAFEILPVKLSLFQAIVSEPFVVVPREAAYTRCDGTPFPMTLDHVTIAKPTRETEPPYSWTMAEVFKQSQVQPPPVPMPRRETWHAVLGEIDNDSGLLTETVFGVELADGENETVNGSVTAPNGRIWQIGGYRRREYLAFAYRNTKPEPSGIGSYIFVRNPEGNAYVGYLTGNDCKQKQVVRIPVVMVKAASPEIAAKEARASFPMHLGQPEEHIMPMRCPDA